VLSFNLAQYENNTAKISRKTDYALRPVHTTRTEKKHCMQCFFARTARTYGGVYGTPVYVDRNVISI